VLIVPGVAGMRQGYRGADREYYRDGFGEEITVQQGVSYLFSTKGSGFGGWPHKFVFSCRFWCASFDLEVEPGSQA